MHPLEGLDSVDWSALRHAFGPADDVPAALRLRADPPSDTERITAGEVLWEALLLAEETFTATAAAVPFVVRMAASPTVPGRRDLLLWLRAVSLAYGDANVLPAVRLGRDVYTELLDDDEPGVRAAAADLLSALGPDETAVARLLGRLDTEQDADVRDRLFLALAGAGTTDVLAYLVDCILLGPRGRFDPAPPWSAAVAAVRLGGPNAYPDARTVLMLGFGRAGGGRTPWGANRSDHVGEIVEAGRCVGDEFLLELLIAGLEARVPREDSETVPSVAMYLVAFLFPGCMLPQPPATLDARQRRGLAALISKMGGPWGGSIAKILLEIGIQFESNQLRELFGSDESLRAALQSALKPGG